MKISDEEIEAAHGVLVAFEGEVTKALTYKILKAALRVRKNRKRERLSVVGPKPSKPVRPQERTLLS